MWCLEIIDALNERAAALSRIKKERTLYSPSSDDLFLGRLEIFSEEIAKLDPSWRPTHTIVADKDINESLMKTVE